MTFNEMGFVKFRDNSCGYRTAFENGLPLGYGEEIKLYAFAGKIDAENRVNEYWDDLHDTTTPLYRAADGQLYKVFVNGSGSVKLWARVKLLTDRAARFKEFRENVCSQRELEDWTGIKRQNICRLESGLRSIGNTTGDVLLRLADALGITVEEMLR